ncbi:MAG: RIP metalloprotease RseP [Campylobacterales bacterium]|nr:RIP metalloprotease RseP [Campylobacterales bacterium]
MSWIVALLILSLLIFFHELGHYSAARYFGVFVEVFSIGFGKAMGHFRMWGTQWQIAAIPLGGYVKMKGQDDTDPAARSQDNDSYNAKKPHQRIVILLAGPAANFALAFVLFFAIALGGPQTLAPVIGEIVPDSPAALAGLQSQDRIKSINGTAVETWKAMSAMIEHSEGTLAFEVERGAFVEIVHVTPAIRETQNLFRETIQRKMIGIASAGVAITQEFGPIGALGYACTETWEASKLIFLSLQKLLTGVVPAKELGGVVSIVQITADASNSGWMALFFFTALISVNLGVLNLLPIPALDGGHIMFNLYELLTRRAPSEAILIKLTVAGWVLLLGLMSLGLYNDINRILGS